MEGQVRVRGLKEFARALGRVSPDVAKELQKAHKRIGEEVASAARSRAESTFGPHTRAAGAITARGSRRSAGVALSPSKDPRIFAAEFGARRAWVFGRVTSQDRLRRRQFPPWTGNQWIAGDGPAGGVGYAVHPTIRDKADDIERTYFDRIDHAFRPAFPD